MCGIAGFTGKRRPEVLSTMLERMRHRGPDDSGTYHDGDRVSLGMVRLSIIDLAGGSQPMANEDDTLWVVFNGEIYNYVELREELAAKGHVFKTASDTETILHAFEEYGLEAPNKFNGMFAIALWDVKRAKLLLIRDRFGVKPLFYALLPDGLAFGSEIKAVLCHPGVMRDFDDEAISQFLSLRYVPAPWTVYHAVRALEPGHLLAWDGREARTERWYELPMKPGVWRDGDEDKLVERLDATLQDAVRLRLRSDVSFGAYLSGGIDSSTVVAMMSKICREPVRTFTLTYSDQPAHKRDAHYARLVSERYGTDHHEYVMEWRELMQDAQRVLRHLDQPFSGVLSSFWLSRLIRQHVKVALAGEGADDVFGSYGHHRLVWPIEQIRAGRSVDFGPFQDRQEWVRALAAQPDWQWRLAYAAFPEDEKEKLLSPEGRERFRGNAASQYLRRVYERSDPGCDALNRMLWLDIHSLLPHELLYYGDMLSMAHSVEVRTPFLDWRVVELAASIPGSLKIRDWTLKYILRRVAARYVPQEILDRSKEGFVLPANSWLRDSMSDELRETLSRERLAIHGFFDAGAIDALVARFMAGDDASTFKVWTLMVFQLWYEDHVGAYSCKG